MTKANIAIIVCGALLLISEIVGHIRIGGKGDRAVMEKLEGEWQSRDGEYEMELERLNGEWVKMVYEMDVYKRRMDSLRGEWAVRSKKVGSIEEWFRREGR